VRKGGVGLRVNEPGYEGPPKYARTGDLDAAKAAELAAEIRDMFAVKEVKSVRKMAAMDPRKQLTEVTYQIGKKFTKRESIMDKTLEQIGGKIPAKQKGGYSYGHLEAVNIMQRGDNKYANAPTIQDKRYDAPLSNRASSGSTSRVSPASTSRAPPASSASSSPLSVPLQTDTRVAAVPAPAAQAPLALQTACASHILVDDQALCRELLDDLQAFIGRRSGSAPKLVVDLVGKFRHLAHQHSTCPSGKDNGGSLGEVQRGSMVKAFNDVVFTSGRVGVVEGPLRTDFGYHLILITRRGDETLAQALSSPAPVPTLGIGGGQQAVEVTFQTRAVDATLQMGAVDRTLQMGAPGSLMRDATTAIVTTAKHNYVAQAPDELSLVKGAVIYVYPNEVEPGWYYGEGGGARGLVPTTHLNMTPLQQI